MKTTAGGGDNGAHYQCAVCELYYAEKHWAEQCEAWCREHASCNVEIIKHAIELKNQKDA